MAKVDLRVLIISLIVGAIFAACSGGAAPSVTPINPTTANGVFAPSAISPSDHKADHRRIAFDRTGKAIKLPSVAGMTEHITLPANDAQRGATLEVTVSRELPRIVSRIPARKSEVFMSFALEASADVKLHGIPKFSVTLRSNPANHGAFYAWAFSPQSGWRDFGPMTVSGNVLTFGGSRKNLKLQRGVVYAVIPFTAAPSESCPGTVLFIGNGNGTITEYAPPYNGPPIATLSIGPPLFAFSASGQLFVADNGTDTVTQYAPPYTGTPVATISNSLSQPIGVAIDASDNLFVANNFNSTVTEYVPPYTGAPITTIIDVNGSSYGALPQSLAFNPAGNLFVGNETNTIAEYTPPFTGTPTFVTNIYDVNGPSGLAFDARGNLFVASSGFNTVTEWAPPYTGSPIATISNGVNDPWGVAIDANGDVFVANQGLGLVKTKSSVTEYAPPYNGAPIATITNGVYVPADLAIRP